MDSEPFGVGVLVVHDGKILIGTRHNDTGYGLICGPGGHGEAGETYEQAAIRETQEEFGITPKNLIPIGTGPQEPENGMVAHIFLCTEYDGEIKCDDLEMVNPRFASLEELSELRHGMFPPFADSLKVLEKKLGARFNLDSADDDTENSENPEIFLDNPDNSATITSQVNTRADGCWVTMGGTHVYVDDNLKVIKGPESLRGLTYEGEIPGVSATGANKFKEGFSKNNLKRHFKDHGAEYPGVGREEYARIALDLIQKPVGKDIDGYKNGDGQVVRYNRKTNDFVKGKPDVGIATMYKPSDGAKYFERQKAKESVDDE